MFVFLYQFTLIIWYYICLLRNFMKLNQLLAKYLHEINVKSLYSTSHCVSLRLKKKFCVSKLPPAFVFLCAFDFAKFRLSFFFLEILKVCCFWKNLSTWELKKRVKSRLISENTEVETFQSFLVSDVRGGKGNWSKKKNKIKNKKPHAASAWKILESFETKYFFF